MGVAKTEITEKKAMKQYFLTEQEIQSAIAKGILHPIHKKAHLGEYRAYPISEIETVDASRPFDAERKKNQLKEKLKIVKKRIADAKKGLEKSVASPKPMSDKARQGKEQLIASLEKELVQLESLQLNDPKNPDQSIRMAVEG